MEPKEESLVASLSREKPSYWASIKPYCYYGRNTGFAKNVLNKRGMQESGNGSPLPRGLGNGCLLYGKKGWFSYRSAHRIWSEMNRYAFLLVE
jgi:hypothetical protein